MEAMLQTAFASLVAGNLDQAENECREVLRRTPDHEDATYLLGRVLERAGRLVEAAELLRRAVAADPAYGPYHTSLGEVLNANGDSDGAIEILREAVRLVPDDPRPRNGLGLALMNAGRFEEAERRFREVLDTDPTWPGVCLSLSRIRRFKPEDQSLLRKMRAVLGHTELPDQVLSDVHFALGKVHDDLEELDTAFEHYRRGNELIRRYVRFDAARHAASVDALTESFTAALFARLRGIGAGAGDALRCTDKMPGNLMHLGLIALVLPRARVVHCRRDPMDTGLSIYTQQFASGHEWAYDLEDIAAFYQQYRRIMRHWEQVLPLEVMEVQYEALVERQEQVSRELVDFCGLPWDAACLEYYRQRRSVGTAANWQVRQPIYRRSVGRWHRYERDLRPLRDALERAARS